MPARREHQALQPVGDPGEYHALRSQTDASSPMTVGWHDGTSRRRRRRCAWATAALVSIVPFQPLTKAANLLFRGANFGTRPVPQTQRHVRAAGRRMHCKLVLDANDADRRTQPAKQARYIDQDARSRGRRASTLCRLGGHAATPVIQHVLQRLTPRRAGRPSQQLPRPRGIATDQRYIGGS